MLQENKFLVCADCGCVVIQGHLPAVLTAQEAINLAVWLTAMARPAMKEADAEYRRQMEALAK